MLEESQTSVNPMKGGMEGYEQLLEIISIGDSGMDSEKHLSAAGAAWPARASFSQTHALSLCAFIFCCSQ
jgi:hypothetical protein